MVTVAPGCAHYQRVSPLAETTLSLDADAPVPTSLLPAGTTRQQCVQTPVANVPNVPVPPAGGSPNNGSTGETNIYVVESFTTVSFLRVSPTRLGTHSAKSVQEPYLF
jgi:hypothetical protein